MMGAAIGRPSGFEETITQVAIRFYYVMNMQEIKGAAIIISSPFYRNTFFTEID
jgi:hypothetical protein